jgi:hypothetical protein
MQTHQPVLHTLDDSLIVLIMVIINISLIDDHVKSTVFTLIL